MVTVLSNTLEVNEESGYVELCLESGLKESGVFESILTVELRAINRTASKKK